MGLLKKSEKCEKVAPKVAISPWTMDAFVTSASATVRLLQAISQKNLAMKVGVGIECTGLPGGLGLHWVQLYTDGGGALPCCGGDEPAVATAEVDENVAALWFHLKQPQRRGDAERRRGDVRGHRNDALSLWRPSFLDDDLSTGGFCAAGGLLPLGGCRRVATAAPSHPPRRLRWRRR